MAVDEKVNGVVNPFEEIGVTGIARLGGMVEDDPLPDLRGTRKIQTLRQMILNDATIGALLFAIKMLLRQMSWRMDAASEDAAAQELAEWYRGALFEDMSVSWLSMMSDIVSFLPWGWSYHELVYKHRDGDSLDPTRRSRFTDGKIGWRKMPIRRQETLYQWILDESGGVQAMQQQASPDFQIRTIPIEKALLFQTENASGNPEGYSILRNAFRAWRMKTRIENLEGIGIERDLAGFPVAWLPPEYMAEDAPAMYKTVYNVVKELVSSIRRDEQEGAVMPLAYNADGKPMFDLRLLTSGGTRQLNIDTSINRYDHRILMSVLADFLMLGAEKIGSLALSSDKTDLFALALGAWADSICDVVNIHGIPRLAKLNGFHEELLPTLSHGDIETPDLEELGNFIQKTVSSGALTAEASLEGYLRQAASLPELPEDVPTVTQ